MGRQTRSTQPTEPSTKQGQPVQTRQTRSSQQNSTSTVTTRSGSNSLTTKTSLNPARSEVITHHRSSGGRHLQPPVGNDAKLKHKVSYLNNLQIDFLCYYVVHMFCLFVRCVIL